MKQATGELNATVFVVVAVASLVVFFYFTIWPMIRNNVNQNTQCSKAICENCPEGGCETVNCYVMENGQRSDTFQCVWKG